MTAVQAKFLLIKFDVDVRVSEVRVRTYGGSDLTTRGTSSPGRLVNLSAVDRASVNAVDASLLTSTNGKEVSVQLSDIADIAELMVTWTGDATVATVQWRVTEGGDPIFELDYDAAPDPSVYITNSERALHLRFPPPADMELGEETGWWNQSVSLVPVGDNLDQVLPSGANEKHAATLARFFTLEFDDHATRVVEVEIYTADQELPVQMGDDLIRNNLLYMRTPEQGASGAVAYESPEHLTDGTYAASKASSPESQPVEFDLGAEYYMKEIVVSFYAGPQAITVRLRSDESNTETTYQLRPVFHVPASTIQTIRISFEEPTGELEATRALDQAGAMQLDAVSRQAQLDADAFAEEAAAALHLADWNRTELAGAVADGVVTYAHATLSATENASRSATAALVSAGRAADALIVAITARAMVDHTINTVQGFKVDAADGEKAAVDLILVQLNDASDDAFDALTDIQGDAAAAAAAFKVAYTEARSAKLRLDQVSDETTTDDAYANAQSAATAAQVAARSASNALATRQAAIGVGDGAEALASAAGVALEPPRSYTPVTDELDYWVYPDTDRAILADIVLSRAIDYVQATHIANKNASIWATRALVSAGLAAQWSVIAAKAPAATEHAVNAVLEFKRIALNLNLGTVDGAAKFAIELTLRRAQQARVDAIDAARDTQSAATNAAAAYLVAHEAVDSAAIATGANLNIGKPEFEQAQLAQEKAHDAAQTAHLAVGSAQSASYDAVQAARGADAAATAAVDKLDSPFYTYHPLRVDAGNAAAVNGSTPPPHLEQSESQVGGPVDTPEPPPAVAAGVPVDDPVEEPADDPVEEPADDAVEEPETDPVEEPETDPNPKTRVTTGFIVLVGILLVAVAVAAALFYRARVAAPALVGPPVAAPASNPPVAAPASNPPVAALAS
jgi:hypothetical protein